MVMILVANVSGHGASNSFLTLAKCSADHGYKITDAPTYIAPHDSNMQVSLRCRLFGYHNDDDPSFPFFRESTTTRITTWLPNVMKRHRHQIIYSWE